MNSAFRGKLLSLLNLHLAGVVLLLVLDIFLGVRLFMAWRASGADREAQIASEQVTYAQLQAQTRRLSNLPVAVAQSRTEAETFYAERIPPNYSAILARLGELSVNSGVRLTRAGYTQAPALEGLAEIRVDANMSGEYPGIMHFVNGLERDRMFFVIDGVTLTGQQGGLVNLRLRLTTYIYGAGATPTPTATEVAARPTVEGVR